MRDTDAALLEALCKVEALPGLSTASDWERSGVVKLYQKAFRPNFQVIATRGDSVGKRVKNIEELRTFFEDERLGEGQKGLDAVYSIPVPHFENALQALRKKGVQIQNPRKSSSV